MENIDRAINTGDIEYVKAHLEENKISRKDINNALRRSAENGQLEVVKYLVEEHQADIHVRDEYALRCSAANGHLDVVKYLVEGHNADIHAADTALRWGASNGHLHVVKYLVSKGSDIHSLDDTALKWSAKHGHLDVVKYLVEKGANIHADNDRSLRWSANNGHLHVVKYLVEKGASVYKIRRSIFIHLVEINASGDAEFIVQYFPKTVPNPIPKEFHEFCLKYGIVYQGSGYESMEAEYRKRKEIRGILKNEIYEKSQEILYRPGGIRAQLMEARFYENAFGCTI